MTEAANAGLERFLGSWELVSFEHLLLSGEVVRPYGDAPKGAILYQADGWMSAQVASDGFKKLASDDPDEASVQEAAQAWRAYFGYWGSFRIDADRQVIVHRVEGGSFPNWIGTEQVRYFRFEGEDRLILEAPSAAGLFRLTWRRV